MLAALAYCLTGAELLQPGNLEPEEAPQAIAYIAGVGYIIGGPCVTLPIMASIYAAGAGPGPVIALLVSTSLLSLPNLLTWQIPFVGVKISLVRYLLCLFVPPLIGLAGAAVYQFMSVG